MWDHCLPGARPVSADAGRLPHLSGGQAAAWPVHVPEMRVPECVRPSEATSACPWRVGQLPSPRARLTP